jgi:membrane protease YdiL (CAAX protease family)
MKTPIGSAIASRSLPAVGCALVGVCAAVADLYLASEGSSYARRWIPGLLAFGVLFVLSGRDPMTLGLRARPIQGCAFWIKASGIALLGITLAIGLVFLVMKLLGVAIPVYTTAPSQVPAALLHMCVNAPLAEETVYRAVICVAFVPLLRPWGTVVVSGALFALLHVIYGNPSPENAMGGLVLAWAYLRSGTILLPLLWHSLGNLLVLGVQLAGWFLTT